MTYNTQINLQQGGSELSLGLSGSLNLKSTATTKGSMYQILAMGSNKWWYSPASPGSPITSASPGDLLWIGGSLPSLWMNISNGTTGSNWDQLQLVGPASAIPAGP